MLSLLFLCSALIVQAQTTPAAFPNGLISNGTVIKTGNVGINQSNPSARLHISDDPSQLNCFPAILINSNV
jgi:hypothetical protein